MPTSKATELHIECFVSPLLEANAYVLIGSGDALVIDPNTNPRLIDYLKTHAVSRVTILLTHEHMDHTCGVPLLAKEFTTHLICQKNCAESLQIGCVDSKQTIAIMLRVLNEKHEQEFLNNFYTWSYTADKTFEKEHTFNWSGHQINMVHTPGHSKGSCCILIDNQALFCGDNILKDFPTITRLPGGNTKDYQNITLPFLLTLPPKIAVFSGHYQTFLLEEVLKESVHVEFAKIHR